MKKFISEFKEFISKGNVIDLAVGIIIGTAFTAIVTSLVNQVIMPAVGMMIGKIDFSEYRFPMNAAKGEAAIYYGSFFQQIINFLIISFVVFCMVKMLNVVRRKKEEEKSAEPSEEVKLLTEIRDLLKEKGQ